MYSSGHHESPPWAPPHSQPGGGFPLPGPQDSLHIQHPVGMPAPEPFDLSVFTRPMVPATRKRTRVRWDNLVIVAVAIAACAIAVPRLISLDDGKARSQGTKAATTGSGGTSRTDSLPATETISVEEAHRLVAQARVELEAGRFDTAESLIADIAGTASDESGASELRNEIATAREEYERQGNEARAAVDEERWADAALALSAAEGLAPLTEDLQQLRTQVDLQADATKAAASVRQLIRHGELDQARTDVAAAFEAYKTEELRDLVTEVEDAMRMRDTSTAKPAKTTKPTKTTKPAASGTSSTSTAQPAAANTQPSRQPPAATSGETGDVAAAMRHLGISEEELQEPY